MPVLHHDRGVRKPQRGRGLAWLLVLPALFLVALVVPVFVPVQVRMNGEEWTASSTWEHGGLASQGISSYEFVAANNQKRSWWFWVLRLGDWHYQVVRSDLFAPQGSVARRWADRKWGVRFPPRGKVGEGE